MKDDAALSADDGNPLEGSQSAEGSDSGDGSQALEALQSQLEALEERRRFFQGESDRRQAQILKLEAERVEAAELAEKVVGLESLMAELASKLDTKTTPSAQEIAAVVMQQQGAAQFQASLAEKFPGVDVSTLKGSFEEMSAAAAEIHAARAAAEASMRAELEKVVRADLALKYGLELGTESADQGDSGSAEGGALTLSSFLDMDGKAMDKLSDEQFDKMMAEAHAVAGFAV